MIINLNIILYQIVSVFGSYIRNNLYTEIFAFLTKWDSWDAITNAIPSLNKIYKKINKACYFYLDKISNITLQPRKHIFRI